MQKGRETVSSPTSQIQNRDSGLPLGHTFADPLSHPLRETSRVVSYLLPSYTFEADDAPAHEAEDMSLVVSSEMRKATIVSAARGEQEEDVDMDDEDQESDY